MKVAWTDPCQKYGIEPRHTKWEMDRQATRAALERAAEAPPEQVADQKTQEPPPLPALQHVEADTPNVAAYQREVAELKKAFEQSHDQGWER
jgi:DNA-directed RNA polymerase subunit K/omega